MEANAQARATSPTQELNTLLFHSTFRVRGPKRGEPNKSSLGTVFVIATPMKDDPTHGNIVLVTAAHVFEDIEGDVAVLTVRERMSDGSYTPFDYPFPIRVGGMPLYVKHGTADVAAMYADLPINVPISGLPESTLATDERIKAIELHPGDEAFVLGFPLGVTGPGGFPILRTAHIASYPLAPSKSVKEIHLDLFLYGGNSGGPVYYSYTSRPQNGQMALGTWQGVLGLITSQSQHASPEFADKQLNLGVMVPAEFIREAIAKLPPK